MKVRAGGWALGEPPVPFDVRQARVIEHADQLSALHPGVRRSLSSAFDVQALADRLCPVERTDGSVTLLARAEYIGGDQAEALLAQVRARGRRLSVPDRYVLPAALLMMIARTPDAILVNSAAAEVAVADRTPTALAGVFQDLVAWGVRRGATDLHLNVLRDAAISEVRFTVTGRYLAPERFRQLPTDLLLDVLAVAWMDIEGGNGAVFDPQREQQGRLRRRVDGREVVLRWASLAAERGPSVCLRFLERDPLRELRTLDALGYSAQQIAQLDRVMCAEGGAVVLAGTVGSGKSTTLAALIERLPEHRKVITLEEPVEYRLERAVQNAVGRDLDEQAHQGYTAKLRTLKRSAMSDVLLGEIRDAESGLAFMDLVGSGVNVYTTVHAPSAHAIVDRLASAFIGVPRDFLVTPGVLKLQVFQVLLPRLCVACARPIDLDALVIESGRDKSYWESWLHWIEDCWEIPASRMRMRHRWGCVQCRLLQVPELAGYAGRTIAAECVEPGLLAQGSRAADRSAYIPDRRYSAMAHAMAKVGQGLIDPRDIEPRFMAFETLALRRRLHSQRRSDPQPTKGP